MLCQYFFSFFSFLAFANPSQWRQNVTNLVQEGNPLSQPPIPDILQQAYDDLTRAERQLVTSLLAGYPVSALGSITAVAQQARVSTPTVARMVQKLGFRGFPAFQAAVRAELDATLTNPIAKYNHWVGSAPDSHILNRLTERVIANIRQSLAQMSVADFEQSCTLMADCNRRLYIAGGADYAHLGRLSVFTPPGFAPGCDRYPIHRQRLAARPVEYGTRRYSGSV